MRFVLVSALVFFGFLGMSACSIPPNPVWDTAQHLMPSLVNARVHRIFLPNYRYIRLERNGEVAFAALGFTVAAPYAGVLSEQIWYTGSTATLMLCDGRLCGSSGAHDEWRQVQLSGTPAWDQMLKDRASRQWQRVRVRMPGYRYRAETMETHLVLHGKPAQLVGISAASLVWFEDHVLHSSDGLPDSLLGVDPVTKQVVYSETCLTRSYCFSWQIWSASLNGGHS